MSEQTTPWTADQWDEWRAENHRLIMAGALLETNQMLDGSVECWAELDGKRWRRDPQWIMTQDGDFSYGPV